MKQSKASASWASAQLEIVDRCLLGGDVSAELAALRAAGVSAQRAAQLYPRDIDAYALGLSRLIDSPAVWLRLRRIFRGRQFYYNLMHHTLAEAERDEFVNQITKLTQVLVDDHAGKLEPGEALMLVADICLLPQVLRKWPIVSANLRAYWTPWDSSASRRGDSAVREVQRKIERYTRYLSKRAADLNT